MNATIYINTESASESYETQLESCKLSCNENAFNICNTVHNTDINEVVNQMNSGEVLVVYSFSQFASTQFNAHTLMETLREKSCSLVSIMEQLNTSKDASTFGLHAWVQECKNTDPSILDKMRNAVKV